MLLHLSMPPRMDPLAGIARIAGFLPMPVIVLTGHAAHDMALKATKAGAWDFIAKPVDPTCWASSSTGRCARRHSTANCVRCATRSQPMISGC